MENVWKSIRYVLNIYSKWTYLENLFGRSPISVWYSTIEVHYRMGVKFNKYISVSSVNHTIVSSTPFLWWTINLVSINLLIHVGLVIQSWIQCNRPKKILSIKIECTISEETKNGWSKALIIKLTEKKEFFSTAYFEISSLEMLG